MYVVYISMLYIYNIYAVYVCVYVCMLYMYVCCVCMYYHNSFI